MKTLDFSAYQDQAITTAIYPGTGEDLGLAYVALGLSNEAGEVAGKVKKLIRDGFVDSPEDRAQRLQGIRDELGDTLWYLAVLAAELDVDLGAIAQGNLSKLADRAARGVLGGSGDAR